MKKKVEKSLFDIKDKHQKNIKLLQNLLKNGAIKDCCHKHLDTERINEENENFIHIVDDHKIVTDFRGRIQRRSVVGSLHEFRQGETSFENKKKKS